MRYLKRLSDSQLYTDVLPWDFEPATPIPDEVRKDKKARDAWINNPKTEHHVWTGWEGINPLARISKPKKDGSGNPPHALHTIAGDYDHPASLELVMELARKMPIVPNWIEQTLSGHWRYVWLLEKPIRVPSYSFAVHFLKHFSEFAFDPARGMMGFDKPAWEAPERLWTNGCMWYCLNETPISEEVATGWLLKAYSKFEFSQREFGFNIPLEKVKEEMEKKYPEFASWPGEFALGEHGPTFWVPESRSPKSATVYENGMRTFSENASKTFYSWSDLLGAAFVKDYQARSAGEAAKDIYFDGKSYWRPFVDGQWMDEDLTTLSRHLIVERGVSSKAESGEASELSTVLNFITSHQRVIKAVPAIFKPSGLNIVCGRRTLNTSTVRVMQPAEGTAIWGPLGQLPQISAFIDTLPGTEHQKLVALAWFCHAYQGAYNLTPNAGQVMFMVGGVQAGKTFLSRQIFGKIMGGFAEAGNWLLGNTAFNSELFYSPWWAMDDSDASSDPNKRRVFSAAIKRIAANREFQFNEKFKAAAMTEWMGRCFITMNGDEESLRMLPDLDEGNLDKIMIIRTKDAKDVKVPRDMKALQAELPWFARWCLDWEIPAYLLGDARFGVKSFHEAEMLEDARQTCPQSGFADILEIWRAEYFTDNPELEYWQGTPAALLMAILANPARQAALGRKSPDAVSRALGGMFAKGYPGLLKGPRTTGTALWRLLPPSESSK